MSSWISSFTIETLVSRCQKPSYHKNYVGRIKRILFSIYDGRISDGDDRRDDHAEKDHVYWIFQSRKSIWYYLAEWIQQSYYEGNTERNQGAGRVGKK